VVLGGWRGAVHGAAYISEIARPVYAGVYLLFNKSAIISGFIAAFV